MTNPTTEQDWETLKDTVGWFAYEGSQAQPVLAERNVRFLAALSRLHSKMEEMTEANEGWPGVIEDAHKRLSDKVAENERLQAENESLVRNMLNCQNENLRLNREVEQLRAEVGWKDEAQRQRAAQAEAEVERYKRGIMPNDLAARHPLIDEALAEIERLRRSRNTPGD